MLSILFVILREQILRIMKKLLPLLVFFSTASLFSQGITVDTDTYTVPQLINNVLINSPCINISNIKWRTGTNFGSVNGIGYFHNTNPNFPMQNGVILSTGNVLNAAGPNNSFLSDGINSWSGDSDLESTLESAGIAMSSVNATTLEFEFVALSPHFDFSFIFASEEYGNFQCQFSDAFAFLLTNLNTGVTTNLAVVPNTNAPISVVTIRDFVYNSTCPSANPQYFGTYNGGSNSANSATNFNGQTVVMNAASVLTPNVPYRIKLVIADRADSQSDSAIFLASNSFNIGQNALGNNLTISDHNAVCFGETHIIHSGLDPNLYHFIWSENGNIIAGQNGPDLTVNQAGNYQMTYTNINFPCQTITNTITVEYYPKLITPNPTNIYHCDNGSNSLTYDLSKNTPIVTNGAPTGSTVNYFATASDAANNTNALPLQYPSSGNETIYIRIQDGSNGCYIIKTFKLLTTNPAVANSPGSITACQNDPNTNNAIFHLSTLNATVLGSQSSSLFSVSYYTTSANAVAGTSPISSTNYTSSGTTIYIRVQLKGDPNCFDITTVNLIVSPLAPVDHIEEVVVCIDYTLPTLTYGSYYTLANGQGTQLFPGTIISQSQTIYIYNPGDGTNCANESNFKVVILTADQLPISSGTYCNYYELPELPYGHYYTAPNGGGTIIQAGTVITVSQNIYYHFQSTLPPFCELNLSFTISISNAQTILAIPDVFDCTSYTLPLLSVGNYYDAPGGIGNQIPAGTVITQSTTLYVFNQIGSCKNETSFNIIIGMNFPTTTTECINYTLPELPIGNYYTGPMGTGTQIAAGTVISNTQTIYVFALSQSLPNCTDYYNFTVTILLPEIHAPSSVSGCGSYTLPYINSGTYYSGSEGSQNELHSGDILTTSQTVYVYITNNSGCQNQISFNVIVNAYPTIDPRPDQTPCNKYILTPLTNGNYYTGINGTGTQLHGGDALTTSQTIYIYASQNGCVSQTSFNLDIFNFPVDHSQDIRACDSYTLPTLSNGNKYYTQTNGPHGTGVEIPAGTVITTNQKVYIFIESGERLNCSNESSFNITILISPVIQPIANVRVCDNYTLPSLPLGNYYTETGGNGTMLNVGDLLDHDQIVYVYTETTTTPRCSAEKSFTVSIFNVDNVSDVTVCHSYSLPTLAHGNYFNAPGGTGGTITPGTILTASKTIYIYALSTFPSHCMDETHFNVTIIDTPVANSIPSSVRTICDSDGTNDGIMNFNLSNFTPIVLGAQIGPEFSVAYYNTFIDANNNTNPVNFSTQSTVFVRVNNSLAPYCYDIKPISIIVNKLPAPTPKDGIICINSKTGQLLNPYVMYSGLSSSTYSFNWYNAQGTVVGTASSYQAISPGVYSLIAINTATGCASDQVFVTVNQSEPAIITYTVSEDFAFNQTVTIEATGVGGVYVYQLDNGPYQESPIFENVDSGIHTITVKDTKGCGLTTTQAIVINYPKFFTPNGDGENDTWNIVDLKKQNASNISIIDRYGKLITEIKPSGHGWNGTYNGNEAIADDYWFIVSYNKDNQTKEFKAHFTLKR